MAEAPGDWKVQVTLDRKDLVETINRAARSLARQKIYYIVSASTEAEALEKAKAVLERDLKIPVCYVKVLTPRRLPM